MPTTETIREIQVLMGARDPADIDGAYILAPNGLPTSSDAGYDLTQLAEKPIHAFLGVSLSAVPTRIDSTVRIGAVVVGEDYTITFDGTGYTYTAVVDDTPTDVAAGLIAAIGAATAAKAAPKLGEGVVDFEGVLGETYTISATGDTPANISAEQDATTCEFELWGYFPARGWHRTPYTRKTITQNEADRFAIAGLERIYVRVISSNGRIKPLVQPVQV